jgi:hypothetical protein
MTLEFQESAQHKGHFALYNCFVLGHTKYNGVQRVNCNPFPAKPYHSSHHLDIVMIRPPGIDNGAFVVSPDTVWYARVLHLLWLTLEPSPLNAHLYQPWKHMTILRMVIITSIICIISIICVTYLCVSGWLAGIYRFQGPLRARLQETNSLLESILGKLPLVPVGDTGTIPHRMRNLFPGAPGDCREGSGDGCRM